MKCITVYVGMDVHKGFFLFAVIQMRKKQAKYPQKVDGHYSKAVNYIEAMRFHTETMLCSYAVMRLAASDSRYTTS